MNLYDSFMGEATPKEVAESIIHYSSGMSAADRERILTCRRIYKNDRNIEEFDYVTRPHVRKVEDECGNIQTETTVLPAKIRHIPLSETYIGALISEEGDRPLLLRAYTTNAESSNQRDDQILRSINQIEESRFINKFAALQLRQKALDIQQQMSQQSQQQPQVDENGQPIQQDPQAQQQQQMVQMQVESQIQTLNRLIESETNVTNEEFESVKKYFYTDYKTPNEHFGELVCEFTISEQRSKRMLNDGMQDKLVTGHEVYHVDWLPGMKDPLHRRCAIENVYFPDNEHVDYLHQHQWCMEINYMTYDNILAEFGMYVTPQVRESLKQELRSTGGQTHNNFQTTQFMPDGSFVGPGTNEKPVSSISNLTMIVRRVYWKKDEKVPVLIRKKKGRPDYITILDQSDADNLMSDKKKMNSRNERIEYRFIERLYMAVRVGMQTYLFCGEHPVQLRANSDKTTVPLPYIGHTKRTDSLLWLIKDLQEMYDLLFYQRELLWMLAGVRGMVYDLSQMPDDMDIEDIVFYRRQGYLFIQSLDKNGKPRQFNQFQNFDDTVSPSIQHVENSLISIQQTMAFVTGMTDPRMGIVKPTDQVGTAQLSYNQSSLITEKIFQEHEDLTELLFSRLVNLAKVAYEDGVDRGSVVVGPNIMKRVFIPRKALDGDYQIKMKSGRKEAKIMEDYKGAAKAMFARGQMNSSMFVETLSVESFVQLKRLISSYDELNRKSQEAAAQGQAQHEKEMLQMQAQLDAETKQVVEKAKGEVQTALAQLKAQVEQQKIQATAQKTQVEAQLWDKDIDSKAQMSKYGVDKDYDIEMKYLAAQERERQTQDKNNKIAMMLDTIQTELKLGKDKEKVHD